MANGSTPGWRRPGAPSPSSAALTFIAAIELIRRIYGLGKYRRYTEDHQGFLEKYNRL